MMIGILELVEGNNDRPLHPFRGFSFIAFLEKPKAGEMFQFYIEPFGVTRTSPVTSSKEEGDIIMFRTKNSTYGLLWQEA